VHGRFLQRLIWVLLVLLLLLLLNVDRGS